MEIRKHYSIVQRKKRLGNSTWYGRTYDYGIVTYASLHTKKKCEAESWRDEMNAERFLPESEKDAKRDRRLDIAVDDFLKSKERCVTIGTLRDYTAKLKALSAWSHNAGIATLRSITPEQARRFSDGIIAVESASTSAQYLMVMRMFCSFARGTYGLKEFSPFDGIKPPRAHKTPKPFWKPEEIDLILKSAPSPKMRLTWALMGLGGLRIHEASKVCSGNIKETPEGRMLEFSGKGGKVRRVPISDRLAREIALTDFSKPTKIFNETCNDALRRVCGKLGMLTDDDEMRRSTAHRFRRSFISNMLASGAPLKAVQLIAGHSSASTTMDIYAQARTSDLFDAIHLCEEHEKGAQKGHTLKEKSDILDYKSKQENSLKP